MKIKFFENAKRRKYVLQINKEFTFEEKSAVEDKIFVLDNEINITPYLKYKLIY